MKGKTFNYPDGVIDSFIEYSFEEWFANFCEFGSDLEKISRDESDLIRHFVLVVPRRDYVSSAISFGFIYSYLENQLKSEPQSPTLEIEQLQVGMTITGFRVPLNPELGNSKLEFVAKVSDISKIHLEENPRISLEVKGKIRDWHTKALRNLRVVNVSEVSSNKVGFYSEDTEYGLLPWKWLMDEKGKEIRSFQNPIINLRKSKDVLLQEWGKDFFWSEGNKSYSAPIERTLCPVKVGIPGPFFIDASLVESQLEDRNTISKFKIQILDSINSIKHNFEIPASNLVVTILAKNENATKNLVSSFEGKIMNSHSINLQMPSLLKMSSVEIVTFGDK